MRDTSRMKPNLSLIILRSQTIIVLTAPYNELPNT